MQRPLARLGLDPGRQHPRRGPARAASGLAALEDIDRTAGSGKPPADRQSDDAAADNAALAGLKRWPVNISYFEQGAASNGEQTPVYSIGFELYENGISRALTLDYGDFVVAGVMSQLEMKDAPACK